MDGQSSPKEFALSLPDADVIDFCVKLPTFDERGWAVTGSLFPKENPIIYIKHGHTTYSMRDSEARTQKWAYEALQKVPSESRRGIRIPEIYRTFEHDGWTYILMEYVPGKSLAQILEGGGTPPQVKEQIFDRAEAGLRLLLSLPVAESVPGPAGGGRIRHPLFKDHRAPIKYDSVDMLEKHLNKVAQLRNPSATTVTLERELHFVFADLYAGNFMFADTTGGDMYIIDFEQAGFLPISLMTFAISWPSAVGFQMRSRMQDVLPQENMEALNRICSWFIMSSPKIWEASALQFELRPQRMDIDVEISPRPKHVGIVRAAQVSRILALRELRRAGLTPEPTLGAYDTCCPTVSSRDSRRKPGNYEFKRMVTYAAGESAHHWFGSWGGIA